MTEFFGEINSIKICYEIQGEGYPLILVHGFGGKKEDWIAQFIPLSKHFKVIRFDNRGAGKSERPNLPYTMEMFVDDTRGLMDFLNIEKAHLMGWSLGGMIVQNFVLKYPEYVNKVVLIASNHSFLNKDAPKLYKEMQIKRLEEINDNPEKVFWEEVRRGFYREFRKKMMADPKKKFYGLWSAEDLIKESQINPPTSTDLENLANALKNHNTYDQLQNIKQPSLLISPSHDIILPKSHMHDMNQLIPNSILKTINKAGHDVPLSRALEVKELIISFLNNGL